MDWKLKTYSRKLLRRCSSDRLTSLPDELLGRILSMLPTKDAAATLILSKRMRNALSWMTSFDLDDSLISHCIKFPHLVERFPLFESFVDNLLVKFSPPNAPDLTRFRLHFAGDLDSHYRRAYGHTRCHRDCFPDVLPARLNEWISYPVALAHGGGLRELDLCFYVRSPRQYELPPSLFTCKSLHVLKFESNLEINSSKVPMINLPNLKLLHLNYLVFNNDDFVSRLVSSCPILGELSLKRCLWQFGDRVSISSPSLQSLVLLVRSHVGKIFGLLLIDTPNLLYLRYGGFVATRYSIAPIAPMKSLVKASIEVIFHRNHFEALLSRFTAFSHVRELSLLGSFVKNLYSAGELRDQLPMFQNLRTLELGGLQEGRWDIVLLLILNRAPSLETLVFARGFFWGTYAVNDEARHSYDEEAALEAKGWRTDLEIPSCRFTHLKRIVVKLCFGIDRELNMIKYLLAKSPVLEELVIYLSTAPRMLVPDPPNLGQFVNIVKEFPRASNSCLISVQKFNLHLLQFKSV